MLCSSSPSSSSSSLLAAATAKLEIFKTRSGDTLEGATDGGGGLLAAPSDDQIDGFLAELETASDWNHGQLGKRHDKSLWNPDYCRQLAATYDQYLQECCRAIQQQQQQQQDAAIDKLLSEDAVINALKVLLKSKPQTADLSQRVRDWERAWGQCRRTPLTDHVSLRLVTANGKGGNVGRVLQLLELRKQYRPRIREFVHAVTSIQAAQRSASIHDMETGRYRRQERNVYVPGNDDGLANPMDNPTRWLDAILLNMHERDVPLTPHLAAHMLQCYASGGYTGKAVHHFYRVKQVPLINNNDAMPEADILEQMPRASVYVPARENEEDDEDSKGSSYKEVPVKIRLEYNRAAPPYFKKPSTVRGALVQDNMTKFEAELETGFSYALSAAFSFADSLQHGACGHAPIQLDTACYNALIKASVQRGALWRAMRVLDNVMEKPTTFSYNLLLQGLARVGDVMTMQQYYSQLLAQGLNPDAFTVRAMVDGLLNVADAAGAVTVIQDCANQHSILPPYTTHLKVLEHCLASELVHEAKRHVYFLQQLWQFEPTPHHSPEFVKLVRATQRNTQLQKPALQKLFAYFGERLDDSDFL